MKLALKKDLGPAREAASAEVDAIFAKRMVDPFEKAHALKAKMAEVRSPLLEFEAERRGLKLDAFCELVLRHHRDAQTMLIAHEHNRQAAKASVLAARSEQEIRAVLSGLTNTLRD